MEVHSATSFGRGIASILVLVGLVFWSSATQAALQECERIAIAAADKPSITVEFIFDKPYPCGRFANGDWWVSGGIYGDVNILTILPAAADGLNGFEVNPSSASRQGFDRRVAGYDRTLQPDLPLRLKGDASVVKAVSDGTDKRKCLPCLHFAAVLTVLAEPLSNSTTLFRPGYFGSKKASFSADGIERRDLPRVQASCCPSARDIPFGRLANRYAGVQLDHIEGWAGRALHPLANMPDYGASIARDSAIALLRILIADFNVSVPIHRAALIGYLQMSIDLLSMAENGVRWGPDGGHGNGRKLPLLFGGQMLGDDRFFHVAKRSRFSEDEQVFFSEVAGRPLFGKRCADAEYWMQQRFGMGPKDCRDPYGHVDGGGQDIGSGYQSCCTAMPWKYTVLATRLLGLEQRWGNDTFTQYVDRWVTFGTWASPDPCSGYNGNPEDYGRTYGPDTYGHCKEGKGRFVKTHGKNKDSGYYGSRFGDQFWNWYVTQNAQIN